MINVISILKFYHRLQFNTKQFLCCKILHISKYYVKTLTVQKLEKSFLIKNVISTLKFYHRLQFYTQEFLCCKINLPNGENKIWKEWLINSTHMRVRL